MGKPDASKKSDNRYVAYWEKQPGYVYFNTAGAPPTAIKIGISTADTMRKRLRQHQSSNHEPLNVLGLIAFSEMEKPMAAANTLEVELHQRFNLARRFSSGPGNEWFNPTNELLEFINSNAKPPEDFGLERSVAKIGPGLEGEI
ncbi:MAG: GIY-YIG nuclease family protein [Gammaproteobacteria bacterium]